MRISYAFLGLGAALLLTTSVAAAPYEAGTVLLRLRALNVVPDFGSSVSLGSAYHVTGTNQTVPEVDVTYFFDPNWSVEVIAGTTKHSLYLNNTVYIGSAWILPPTVTLQYHFDLGRVQPYLGAGLNYSLFYGKDTVAGLGKLKLTDQWGGALQAGADFPLGADGKAFFNIDVKKIFVSTHASYTAAPVTANVDVNPWLIGAGIGYRF